MIALEHVKVEVEVPPSTGRFLVSIGHVGDALSLPGVAASWVDITPAVREIRVERGGARRGVVTALDVGTLTATLVDGFNPRTDHTLQPSRRVRLRTLAGVALWTGQLIDIATESTKDKAHAFTTFVAADAVQSLENTMAYGAISGNGYEPWAARIQRLCRRAVVPTNPPGA